MLRPFRRNLTHLIALPLVTFGCIVSVLRLQLPQLNALKQGTKSATAIALQREVKLERLRLDLLKNIPAFSFDNLLADWVFISFLIYFGDNEARAATDYRLSPEYFEVIIDRDPKFLDAYLFLSASSSLYAGMPERSVALMSKGLESLSPQVPPRSYYIWRYKGIDELLFLGDANSARKSFENAAKWASTYADLESQQVAARSIQTAEFISLNPNSRLAQVSAWSMVLENAVDERTRNLAINRIEKLGGNIIVTPEGRLRIQLQPEN
ncbi:MAG: hypothetical protein F6J89_23835 [Symploca sp. SIO1C4]|uniref:Tetratricopeptide repeat protein n=1 Tax=Symploca sp. SIO1C4 TaxID=2607765 RepID=A0A6B3NKB1_9CYAN|nr:hypothetical protein [Symploca sp. SIO1C4]